jgi:DNA-directed RNA polymerase beta' subunit
VFKWEVESMGRKYSRQYLEKLVRNELHELSLCVQDETLGGLIKYNGSYRSVEHIRKILSHIKREYEQREVEEGDSVGIIAAQSLGEPSTQMILRTFHYAGVGFAHMTGGLERIQEIIHGMRRIKNPVMKIILTVRIREEAEAVLQEIMKVININVAALYEENGIWVVYTKGSNLMDILSIDGVDHRKVFTNDIREIEKVLGIEAARRSIIDQLYEIYESEGLDVDLRHLILIADVMTQHGIVQGLNSAGIMKHKSSIIARMAFEDTCAILYDAALHGDQDNLEGVTENIIAGVVVKRGTGNINLWYQE